MLHDVGMFCLPTESAEEAKLVDQSHLPSAVPTPRQLEYQDWEMGAFFHFGIRTFYEGHRDWDGRPMPPERFRPAGLNCDNWIASIKRAGMQYAVLVCKHHDGFANWPSKSSSYSVAQTPWLDGRGDVVREFTDACRRRTMKVGLYYSPAEWGSEKFKDAKAYDEHFINQITELLGNYGPIDILWFDGCGSEGHTYDWPRIICGIRRLQPNLLIFNMGDPDFRWVGNEAGVANLPLWNTAKGVRRSVNTEGEEKVGEQPLWLPAECDCMMRWRNWFYEEGDTHTVKPVEELIGLYYLSVGRGANLLINIGPDRRGLLPDPDREALLAFGAEVRRRFGIPLADLGQGTLTERGWEYASEEPFYLDHVVIQEDLSQGEAVRRFAVHIETGTSGRLICVYEGRNIGHKAICRLPLLVCCKVVVEIIESDRPAKLRNVTLHNSSGLQHRGERQR
jgi:alpha-L-fucosidase